MKLWPDRDHGPGLIEVLVRDVVYHMLQPQRAERVGMCQRERLGTGSGTVAVDGEFKQSHYIYTYPPDIVPKGVFVQVEQKNLFHGTETF